MVACFLRAVVWLECFFGSVVERRRGMFGKRFWRRCLSVFSRGVACFLKNILKNISAFFLQKRLDEKDVAQICCREARNAFWRKMCLVQWSRGVVGLFRKRLFDKKLVWWSRGLVRFFEKRLCRRWFCGGQQVPRQNEASRLKSTRLSLSDFACQFLIAFWGSFR